MYIDTHCHLAWGIDDGIENKQQAKNALQDAVMDGITEIIATPHFVPGFHEKKDIDEMNQRIQDLQKLGNEQGVVIYPGSELFLNYEYLEMIEEGLVNTLNNSHYLLVEFDTRKNIDESLEPEEMLYELRIRNYIPIIAHVERYFKKKLDIERIREWVNIGCKIQINRTSILGLYNKQCQKYALSLLKHGLVHIVATDAHRDDGNRRCILSDVVMKLEKLVGKENAILLCHDNPLAIIDHCLLKDMNIVNMSFLRRFLHMR